MKKIQFGCNHSIFIICTIVSFLTLTIIYYLIFISTFTFIVNFFSTKIITFIFLLGEKDENVEVGPVDGVKGIRNDTWSGAIFEIGRAHV